MLDSGYSTEYIGLVSTVFMITYGVGQLLNGMIGDRIKAKTGPPSVSFSALRKLPKNAIKGLQKRGRCLNSVKIHLLRHALSK